MYEEKRCHGRGGLVNSAHVADDVAIVAGQKPSHAG